MSSKRPFRMTKEACVKGEDDDYGDDATITTRRPPPPSSAPAAPLRPPRANLADLRSPSGVAPSPSRVCQICFGTILNAQSYFALHENDPWHVEMVRCHGERVPRVTEEGCLLCVHCNVKCPPEPAFLLHEREDRHVRQLAEMRAAGDDAPPLPSPTLTTTVAAVSSPIAPLPGRQTEKLEQRMARHQSSQQYRPGAATPLFPQRHIDFDQVPNEEREPHRDRRRSNSTPRERKRHHRGGRYSNWRRARSSSSSSSSSSRSVGRKRPRRRSRSPRPYYRASSRSPSSRSSSRSSSSSSSSSAPEVKTLPKFVTLSNKVIQVRTADHHLPLCHKCGGRGHEEADCTTNHMTRLAGKCKYCGGKGHWPESCASNEVQRRAAEAAPVAAAPQQSVMTRTPITQLKREQHAGRGETGDGGVGVAPPSMGSSGNALAHSSSRPLRPPPRYQPSSSRADAAPRYQPSSSRADAAPTCSSSFDPTSKNFVTPICDVVEFGESEEECPTGDEGRAATRSPAVEESNHNKCTTQRPTAVTPPPPLPLVQQEPFAAPPPPSALTEHSMTAAAIHHHRRGTTSDNPADENGGHGSDGDDGRLVVPNTTRFVTLAELEDAFEDAVEKACATRTRREGLEVWCSLLLPIARTALREHPSSTMYYRCVIGRAQAATELGKHDVLLGCADEILQFVQFRAADQASFDVGIIETLSCACVLHALNGQSLKLSHLMAELPPALFDELVVNNAIPLCNALLSGMPSLDTIALFQRTVIGATVVAAGFLRNLRLEWLLPLSKCTRHHVERSFVLRALGFGALWDHSDLLEADVLPPVTRRDLTLSLSRSSTIQRVLATRWMDVDVASLQKEIELAVGSTADRCNLWSEILHSNFTYFARGDAGMSPPPE